MRLNDEEDAMLAGEKGEPKRWKKIIKAFGWLLGTCFSLLPRKMCFHFHSEAEKRAADNYKIFINKLDQTSSDDLKHKEKFKSLLKTMMNNEFIHSEIFTFHSNLYEKQHH